MPGRPACSVKATRHAMTKEEKAIRTSIEDAGKGLELPATPPKDMSTAEKKIYRWLYRNLQENRFLGQLDIETMKEACFIIAGLHTINVEIRNDPTKLTDRDISVMNCAYLLQPGQRWEPWPCPPINRKRTLCLRSWEARRDEKSCISICARRSEGQY